MLLVKFSSDVMHFFLLMHIHSTCFLLQLPMIIEERDKLRSLVSSEPKSLKKDDTEKEGTNQVLVQVASFNCYIILVLYIHISIVYFLTYVYLSSFSGASVISRKEGMLHQGIGE